ncbi:MAG: hypothetical protein IH994_07925 [Proteobacteria bacterium]|nr:hypothetical protein [Pseudomonadota bacterium]
MRHPILSVLTVVAALCTLARAADDPVFSGPQVGEKLPPFKVKAVFDDLAGKELDLIAQADGKPIALIFFHARTRPAFGLTNAVMRYAATRSKDGLTSGVIFLTEDVTATEKWMNVVREHFPKGPTMGVSLDGQEGPGAYGLNRKVSLTVLVGKEGKVTANFAIVQPDMKVDGSKILKAIVDTLGGGDVPDIEKLAGRRYQPATDRVDPKLGGLVRSVIRKDATAEEVKKAAAVVEEYVAKNRAAKKQLGQIAGRVVNSGKLSNYGTPAAQDLLRKWAKAYGAKGRKDNSDGDNSRGDNSRGDKSRGDKSRGDEKK